MKTKLTLLSLTLFTFACGSAEDLVSADLQEQSSSIEIDVDVDEGTEVLEPNDEAVSITINRYSPPQGISFSSTSTDLEADEIDLTFNGCRGSYILTPVAEDGICVVANEEEAFALGADPSQCDWISGSFLGETTTMVVVDRSGENYFMMDIEESDDGMTLTFNLQPLRQARCSFVLP